MNGTHDTGWPTIDGGEPRTERTLGAQSVVAALPTPAAVLDASGRVVAMNDGMAALLDTSPAAAAGREYRSVFAPETGASLLAAVLATPLGADRHDEVVRVDGASPATAVYETRCSRPNERGELERFVYRATPTVEGDSLRAVLLTAEPCESDRETYPGLVGVLAHDLRNLLNVVTLFVDRAATDIDDDHYGPLRQNLDRMEALIEDALALATHAGSTIEPEPLSLARTAEHAWIHVDTGVAELVTEDARIEADENALCQLFENLFRNAVEHSSTSHADADASADAVERGSTSPDSQTRQDAVERGSTNDEPLVVRVGPLPDGLYVEDTGCGIPEADRPRVFEHGYTTSEDGTGMGLSIVHALVEEHGWEITLTESEAGGARFEITGPTL